MNHKTLNALFWIFTLLPFLIAILLLFVLPETIPTHWTDTSQEPDGYGSKYTLLLIPVLFSASSFTVKIITRFTEKVKGKENTKSDQIIYQYFPLLISFFMFGVSLWLFWLVVSTSLFA
jgi:Protein of unknown function (DUF1648).